MEHETKWETILSLPLEIRRQIYSHLLPDVRHPIFLLCQCPPDPGTRDGPAQPCQLPPIMPTSPALQQDFLQNLTAEPLSIACRSDSAFFRTSLPCLSLLSLSPSLLPPIHIVLTPFLLGSSLRPAFASLLRIGHFLNRAPTIPTLSVTVDGRLPRAEPPWLVGEFEIERAPLITALLLEPFTVLRGKVSRASVKIEGGPLHAPWAAMPLMREYAGYVEGIMTGARGGGHGQERRSRERLLNLGRLVDDEGALWSLLGRPDGAFDRVVGDSKLSGFRCDG